MGNSSSFFQDTNTTPPAVPSITQSTANSGNCSSLFQDTNPTPVALETIDTLVATASVTAQNAATTATTQAAAALASQTAAAASQSAASASQASATASASSATSSASAAATSASAASASATTATTQAGIATTQAGIATTQAGNASTSATNAASSATAASGSATTASTQATNAATSATGASTSATNASTSATNAAASATLASNYATGFTIGTVTTGTAGATITGSPGSQHLNLVLPTITAPTTVVLGGVFSSTNGANQFATGINTSGAVTYAQPAFGNISGTVAAAQLPNPGAAALGGVKSQVAVATNFMTGISTAGAPTLAQPTFTDISGTVGASQLPNPAAATLGGVKSLVGTNALMMTGISTAGVPTVSTAPVGFRNRLINGQFIADQRNAMGSTACTNASFFAADRWMYYGLSSKFNSQVVANAGPIGSANCLTFTVASAYAVTSSDAFGVFQRIEGVNWADLNFGTASAQTVTLSFMVKSSVTGLHAGSLRSASNTRSYPFSFTISVANTWTYVSITIPGDTSGGTWVGWGAVNAAEVVFNLGAGATFTGTAGAWASSNLVSATGAVSVVGTASATFSVGMVQIEAGSYATPFEQRGFVTEYQMCQRYYQAAAFQSNGNASGTGIAYVFTAPLPIVMRAAPTVATSGTSAINVTGQAVQASTNTLSVVTQGAAAGGYQYSGTYTLNAEL